MTVYQTLDVGFGGHALDIEGNFVESHDLKILSPKPHQLPTKAKSLGGVDTLTQMGPQLPQVLDQVNSIMDMMKAQAEEMKVNFSLPLCSFSNSSYNYYFIYRN